MNIQVINKSKHSLPAYATELSAGMDIRANLSEPITLEPLQRCLVPTGLYIALHRDLKRKFVRVVVWLSRKGLPFSILREPLMQIIGERFVLF